MIFIIQNTCEILIYLKMQLDQRLSFSWIIFKYMYMAIELQ